MNRKRRLQSAPRWVAEYRGSNIIRSYRKRYGVDWLCAIEELRLLGARLDPVQVSQLRRTAEEQAKKNYEKRLEQQLSAASEERSKRQPDSDEHYYFIAGLHLDRDSVRSNVGRNERTRTDGAGRAAGLDHLIVKLTLADD